MRSQIVAFSLYAPAVPFAVAVTLARPAAFVVAGEPLTMAEAPEPGGASVTCTPGTGLPLASVTSATSGAVKAVFTAVVWLLPALTAIVVAAPAVLVSANDAELDAPGTEAVTA